MLDTDALYDVVIAGGGPAGCVLASRLSEESSKRILLIEAGPDFLPGAEPAEVLDPFAPAAYGNAAFHWSGLVAEDSPDPGEGKARVVRSYLQARCIGGGSNINGMAADRGQPGDYDLWERAGATGWGWDAVLPYFKKLEHDLDFSSGQGAVTHGAEGPMPVRRLDRSQWAPFAASVCSSLERRGFQFLKDYNAEFGEGVASVPTNCLPEHRVSASMAYLTREARARPNLTILVGTKVSRLNFSGDRVDGVYAVIKGADRLLRAREVIASCGALQSPTLLLRSGIGPAAHLRARGVAIVRDLPGVGSNLQNHPALTLTTYLRSAAAQPPQNLWFLQNCLRFSSRHPACEDLDMHLMPFNKCAWHALGSRVGAVFVSVLNPKSRGTVRLSADLGPDIKFNLLDDPRDSERLVIGLRLALEVLLDEHVQHMRRDIFVPDWRLAAKLDARNRWNQIRAKAITRLLDWSPLRRRVFSGRVLDPERMLTDNTALREFVRAFASMQYHVCGTCRMGSAEDPEAVVDPEGRVHGVGALRVVDASIFPTAPRGYTHFVVLMAAEKVASCIRQEWGSSVSFR